MAEHDIHSTISRFIQETIGREDGLSDSELLARFAATRDKAAFESLVWRHASMVLRVSRAVLRDQHEAEDAAQAVFLVLARKASSIRSGRSLGDWLCRTAHRIAVNAGVKRGRTPGLAEHLPIRELDAPVNDPAVFSETPIVQEEVMRLPEVYRLPVILHFFEGLSYAETARRLECPIGSVAGRISRAKDILHSRLLRRGVTASAVGAILIQTPAGAVSKEFVLATTQASTAFAAQAFVKISTISMKLAQGELRSMFTKKLRWLTLAVASCVAATTSSLAVGDKEKTEPIPKTPGITVSMPILAPLAKQKVGIDPEIVKEYARLGAIYGGFEYLDTGRLIEFTPGEEAAARSVPGFQWRLIEALPTNLPRVDVPYGIELSYCLHGTQDPLDADHVANDLKSLKNPKNLTVLVVGGGRSSSARIVNGVAVETSEITGQVNDDAMKAIGSMTGLRILYLTSNISPGAGYKEIAKLKNLERLDPGAGISDDGLKELGGLKNLSHLDLWESNLTRADLKEIATLKNLTWLRFGSNEISDDDLRELAPLANLTWLWLPDGKITNDGMKELRALKKLTTLVPPSSLTGAGIGELEPLENLSELYLNATKVRDADMKDVARLKSLTFLRFPEEITNAGLKELTVLKKLRTISMEGKNVDDDSLQIISPMKSLTSLKIDRANITDKGMKDLASLSELESLDFFGIDNVTHQGWKELAVLKNLSSLTLDCVEITDDELKEISAFSNLRSLHLRSGAVSITEGGLHHLAALVKLEKFEVAVPLDDKEVKELAACESLKSLKFHGIQITDASLEELTKLKKMKRVLIGETKVTREGVAKLRKALPECLVSWDEGKTSNSN